MYYICKQQQQDDMQNITISQARSIVCRMAYSNIQRRGTGQSRAMSRAWQVVKLLDRMMNGEVSFMFEKLDGSVRTMSAGPIEGVEITSPADQVCLVDNDLGAYRSFLVDQYLEGF